MSKILVGIKRPNEEIEYKKVENNLESIRKEIGCEMAEIIYPLGKIEEQGIILVGDEEAKLTYKECNFWLYDKKDCFNGTAVFIRDSEENFGCLKETDKALIDEYLKQNKMNYFEKIQVMQYIKETF